MHVPFVRALLKFDTLFFFEFFTSFGKVVTDESDMTEASWVAVTVVIVELGVVFSTVDVHQQEQAARD